MEEWCEKREHWRVRTNGRVAKVEPVYAKHSQEEGEAHSHVVVVAWLVSITQFTVWEGRA